MTAYRAGRSPLAVLLLILFLGACAGPDSAGGPLEPAPAGAGGGEGRIGGEEAAQRAAQGSAAPRLVLEEKWYQDSDGNAVPDFIEVANGFDPTRYDCAPERCPAAGDGVEFATSDRNALLVLDSSGSMAGDAGGGQSKMDAAKRAMTRYAGVSSLFYKTGFAAFGHTGDNSEAGKATSCTEASEVLLPLGRVEPGSIGAALSPLRPTGWTPIEGALREAETAFAGTEGAVNRVILVSDGIETCGGNPVAAAERLHGSGIGLQVDVVGFGVDEAASRQLRQVAAAGGGEYVDAKTGADLDTYFRQQSEAIGQTWDAFACQLRNSTFDTICDQNQCNDATVFRIPDEMRKYDVGSPEHDALRALSDRISDGLEKRQEARREAGDRAQELYAEHARLRDEYRRVFDATYR